MLDGSLSNFTNTTRHTVNCHPQNSNKLLSTDVLVSYPLKLSQVLGVLHLVIIIILLLLFITTIARKIN